MNRVFVYRNLNRKGVVWSIKDCKTNLVIDRVTEAYFENVELKVSQAGRQRVLLRQKRNVHAGIIGTRIFQHTYDLNWTRVSYNPYINESFVLETGEPITKAKFAKLTEHGLFVSN